MQVRSLRAVRGQSFPAALSTSPPVMPSPPSQAARRTKRISSIARCSLFGVLLPCVYLFGAGAMFVLRHRAANASVKALRLPLAPIPSHTDRLIVFAPHCDDETLGCGGLIQQTLAAGGEVRVAILTNGDDFRTAVEREARTLRVGPSDYIAFAGMRQRESLRALAHLGVPARDVYFLGYPDGGLNALWNDYWSESHPYRSPSTRAARSPYALTFDTNARYCGADVLRDVESLLQSFRPTVVAVTHPSEDHPDHSAASSFVDMALRTLGDDPSSAWARSVPLLHYIVHRGDWPVPQGLHPDAPLAPPAEMADLDTRWLRLPLTAAQAERKEESIQLYPSQTTLMGRFLRSFARSTELFGELPTERLEQVPDGSMRFPADAREWERLTPAELDPVRDNVVRDLQGGGDIRDVYACEDSRWLYVRIETRQPISDRITYTLRVRAFGPNGATAARALTLRSDGSQPVGTAPAGVRIADDGSSLETAIPLPAATPPAIGAVHRIAISADTAIAGVEIDKTGARILEIRR